METTRAQSLPLSLNTIPKSNHAQNELLASSPTYRQRSLPDRYPQILPASWPASVHSPLPSYSDESADLLSVLYTTTLSPVMSRFPTMPSLAYKHLPTSSNIHTPAKYHTTRHQWRWPLFTLMPFTNQVRSRSAVQTSFLTNRLNSTNPLPTDGPQCSSPHINTKPWFYSDMYPTNFFYSLLTTMPSFTS